MVLSCPDSMILETDEGQSTAIVSWRPPRFQYAVNITQAGPVSGSALALGIHEVIYTASGYNDISATCAFYLTVVDREPPSIVHCPGDLSTTTDFLLSSGTVAWRKPVYTDNVNVSSVFFTLSRDISGREENGTQLSALFPFGETTVFYLASDQAGNTNLNCSFTVTVIDEEPPTIYRCPTAIQLPADQGSAEATVTWLAPTTEDNVGASLLASHESGDRFPVGLTRVIYRAVDAGGNTALCTFTVNVLDQEPPRFEGCLNDLVARTRAGEDTVAVNWSAPVAVDSADGEPRVTSSHAPGDLFAVGATRVTYTAVDASGNTARCLFTVHVEAGARPVFSTCPDDTRVATDPGRAVASVTWTPPEVAFAEHMVGVESSDEPGAEFSLGATPVL